MNPRTPLWILIAVLIGTAFIAPVLALDVVLPEGNETIAVPVPMPAIDEPVSPIEYIPPQPQFAWKSEAGWQNESLPIAGYADLSAFDSSGFPHIITTNWSEGTTTYAWKDASGWKTEPVTVSGYGSSIALDQAGEPHMMMNNKEYDGLSYVWRQGGVWQSEPVPGIPYADVMAYDANGVPSMLNYQWEGKTLGFTFRGPSGWTSETLPFSAIPSAMIIPADGIPRAIYTEDVYRTVPVVDVLPGPEGDVPAPEGDVPPPDIMVKEAPPGEQLNPDGTTTGTVSTVYDPSISISAKRTPDVPPLGFAWKDASGWHNETIDTAGFLNTFTCSPAGDPALLYGDGYSGALKYAWKDASGWHTETTPFSGYAYGLMVDTSEITRTAYSDYNDGSLHYAYRDGSGWHDEPSGISYADIVQFDKSGTLRAITTDWTSGTITYHARTDSGWQKEPLSYTGYPTLFGTDQNGMPRMLYNTWVFYPVLYAMDGGTGSEEDLKIAQVRNGKPQAAGTVTNTTSGSTGTSFLPLPTTIVPAWNTHAAAGQSVSDSSSGSIRLVSIPKGASVYIGGEKKGETPLVVSGLTPGAASVRLEMAGYDSWKKTLQVKKGKVTNSGKIILTPAVVHTGSIRVTTVPSGATVTIDGKEVGLSPITVKELSVGTHVVNLTLAGYPSWEKKVEVRSGKMVPITRFLKSIMPSLKKN